MFTSHAKGITHDNAGSIRDILVNSDQEELFRSLAGIYARPGEKFRNPHREDKKPGCFLEYRDNILYMFDWGDEQYYHANIVNVICASRGISYKEAKSILLTKYGKFHTTPQAIINSEPFRFHLHWKQRLWNVQDKKYWWGKYGITKDFLVSEDTAPVLKYWMNRRKDPHTLICIQPNEPTYSFIVNNRVKIYRPHSKVFVTNQNPEDVGGISNLDTNNPLIITKSFKDYSVLTLNGFNSRYLLSESISLPQSIFPLFQQFPKVIILTDNDEAGIKASQRYSQETSNYSNVHCTVCPLSKDPSDMVEGYGQGALRLEINNIL